VLVGEATRRATERRSSTRMRGTFELKGKEEVAQLWKALRVVSGVRGTLKSHGLEAPFVGRDASSADQGSRSPSAPTRARHNLVSVTGIAVDRESRLAWEFYKYFDRITQITRTGTAAAASPTAKG
jgi:hypothetical protein